MSIAARRIGAAQSVKDEGNYLRRITRRNKGEILTNSEVKVLVELVNLWLYHRNGPKGYIHPGREKIANKVRIHSKTVSRSLDTLRGLGIAIPIKNLKGGNGRATQYRVDTARLKAVFDPSNVVQIKGELVQFSGTSERAECPTTEAENVPQQPGQNVPLSKGVGNPSTGKVESEAPTMNPFADIGVGHLLRNDRATGTASASPSKPATSATKQHRKKWSAT